jgi:hypothetical protein
VEVIEKMPKKWGVNWATKWIFKLSCCGMMIDRHVEKNGSLIGNLAPKSFVQKWASADYNTYVEGCRRKKSLIFVSFYVARVILL